MADFDIKAIRLDLTVEDYCRLTSFLNYVPSRVLKADQEEISAKARLLLHILNVDMKYLRDDGTEI